MLTDEEINTIGFTLEDEGFSHSDIDDYLEHHGVKGMKWGSRRAAKKIGAREVKNVAKANKANEKAAAKSNPAFKQEVKATQKGRGITVKNPTVQTTVIGGLRLSRMQGQFKNSQGHKVSEDFANAVVKKAVSKERHKMQAKAGAVFVAAALGTFAAARSVSTRM